MPDNLVEIPCFSCQKPFFLQQSKPGSSLIADSQKGKSDAADGSYIGTITMTDGTVITFAVVLNPAYNGVYRLALKSYKDASQQHKLESPADVFIQYNDVVKENGSPDGYKLIATDNYKADYEADKMFTITPMGNGYMLSAQGLYLKQPDLATWNHVAFSDVKGEAGAYLLTAEGDEFRIHSVSNGINHLNAYSEFVFGNDSYPKFSTFTVTKITTYPLAIPAGGMATLCLPFNIVLPEGVEAYDVTVVEEDANSKKVYELHLLATAGETVKAGTPVIMKGNAGDYTLGVTVDNAGAKGALAGSLLRGNFLKQSLAAGSSISKYTFIDNTFNLLSGTTEFPANSVWMELAEVINSPIEMGEIVKPDLLGDLIAALDELIEQVAEIDPVGKATELLLTTDENGPYYIWSNAPTANEGVGNLLDGDNGTILHTEWNAGAVTSGDHYLAVDLGDGNELSNFVFGYKARTGNSNQMNFADIPSRIDVYGCNTVDGEYVLLSSITGLRQDSGFEYQSEVIKSVTPYRFLRFNVFANNGYWHMAEFNLYKATTLAVVADEYKDFNGITDAEVAAAYDAMVSATNVHQNGTENEKKSVYDVLKPIYDALYEKLNNAQFELPEVGKVYRMKSYVSNVVAEYQNHYLVNGTTGLTLASAAATDNTDLWVCTSKNEAEFTFVSTLGTAALGWQAATEDAVVYTLSVGVASGAFTLTNGDNNLAVNIDAAGNTTFTQSGAKTQSAGWSTDWYFEEVEDAAVSYATTIANGNMWATMYLPFAVKVPAGVEAYVATGIEGKAVNLTQVENNIPKNTAVLLHRADDTNTDRLELAFDLADGDVAAVGSNLFEGKIRTTAISAKDARVYLLVKYNGNEKFYWMQDEYNESCAFVGAGSGYVKCDVNKCYLRIEDNASPASSYSFRFDGTTGVEEVKGENGKVKTIYDLQGRKLTEVTKPSFYIVDGEKVWIK